MIVSDKHKFIFVHIPKCAGTSIRRVLSCYDDLEGAHTSRVDHHEVLGELDYVHIPLAVLREHFPEVYAKFAIYWSFSVVRDPFERFRSSVAQRLRMYKKTPIAELSTARIQLEIVEVIAEIVEADANCEVLPPNLIHFQRQIDYIFLNGKQIVASIYPIGEVPKLFVDVENITGAVSDSIELDPILENRTLVFRNSIAKRAFMLAAPYKTELANLLPKDLMVNIRKILYKRPSTEFDKAFNIPAVDAFIWSFYKDDIALFQSALQTSTRG